jgi:hypothetical protein
LWHICAAMKRLSRTQRAELWGPWRPGPHIRTWSSRSLRSIVGNVSRWPSGHRSPTCWT